MDCTLINLADRSRSELRKPREPRPIYIARLDFAVEDGSDTIYILRSADKTLCKIGIGEPGERGLAYTRAYPELRRYKFVEHARYASRYAVAVERYIHRHLRDLRLEGTRAREVFRISPLDAELVVARFVVPLPIGPTPGLELPDEPA